MLVSCVPRHTGFCRASDDACSLWEVLFWTPNRAFVWQFAPPPSLPLGWPWWLLRLVTISNEFLSATVPGGGCCSVGCSAYLHALLETCILLCTNLHFHGHLPQAYLLMIQWSVTHSVGLSKAVTHIVSFTHAFCGKGTLSQNLCCYPKVYSQITFEKCKITM